MAATEVGTAYVIIRAITSQLSKDIQDGLDKGAKDADTDEAGRTLGRNVGDSAGDEFGVTWNDRSSDEIERSADSREMRRSTDRFADRLGSRFSDAFDDNDEMTDSLRRRMETSIGEASDDVDVDRAAGTLGDDLADEQGNDYDVAWKRNVQKTFETTDKDDGVNRGLSGMTRRIGKKISDAFTRDGSSWATGIQKAFTNIPGINWLTILGIPGLLNVALPLLGALIGQAISILGFLTTAALGGVVAMGGLVAAIGPAVLVLMSAFKVESDELDAFNERVEEFMIAWDDIALATQEPLFTGLTNALDLLQGSSLIPTLTEYGARIGGIVGDLAEFAAAELTTPGALSDIDAILSEGAEIFKTLGAAAVTMIRPILRILRAAMPFAQKFADSLLDMAERFSAFIDQKGTQGLTDTFSKWYERLRLVGSILGNVFRGLWNILNIGADDSDSMFVKFDAFTEKWAEWTGSDEGQKKIKTFFEETGKVARELWGLVGDIIALFVGPMTDTGGSDTIVSFIKSIRETWLPALVELSGALTNALGLVWGFVQTVLGWIGEIAGFFDRIFGTNLREDLGPFLLQVGLVFVVLSKLKLLSPILKTFGIALRLLITPLKLFAGAIRAVGLALITNPWVLAIIAIVAVLTLLYFHVKPFREFIDKYFIDPLQRFWTALGGFAGAIDLIKLAFTDFDAALEKFKGLPIISDLIDLFSFGESADELFGALGNAGEVLAEFFGNIIDWIVENLPKIGTLLGEGVGKLYKLLLKGIVILIIGAFKLLFPALLKLITNIPRLFVALLQYMWNFWSSFFKETGLIDAAKKYFPIVIDAIVEFFKDLPALIGTALGTLGEVIGDLAGRIGTWFSEHRDEIVEVGNNIVQWIGERLVDIGSWLVRMVAAFGSWLWDHKDEFGQFGLDVLTWIGERLGDIGGWLADMIVAFGNYLWEHKGDIGQFGLDILTWIGEKLKDVGELLFEWIAAFGEWFKQTGAPALITLGGNILGWIFDGLVGVGKKLFVWLGDFGNWFKETGAPGLVTLGGNILGWIFDGLLVVGEKLLGWLADFGAWFRDHGAQGLLDLGKNILGWIFDGLVDVGSQLLGWLEDFRNWFFDSGKDSIIELGVDILQWIFNGLIDVGGQLLEWVFQFGEWLIEHGPDAFLTIGKNILGYIFQGIKNADELGAMLLGWVGAVIGWIGDNWQEVVAIGLEIALAIGEGILDLVLWVAELPMRFIRWVLDHGQEFKEVGIKIGNKIKEGATEAVTGIFDMSPDVSTSATGEGGRIIADAFVPSDATMDAIADQNWTAFVSSMAAQGVTHQQDLIDVWVAAGNEVAPDIPHGWANSINNQDWSVVGGAVNSAVTGSFSASELQDGLIRNGETAVNTFGTAIGDQEQLMVAPTNKLVDMILLTLARLGNEVTPKVINPFILNVVVGINTAATQAVAATNKLVDRVLLTLARIGNETPRTMNPFILYLVDAINDASTQAVSATNRLVNAVLLTVARIGNEVGGRLSTVAGTMSDVLTSAGTRAADGLERGFELGLASLLGYLRTLDSVILDTVGDLSGVLEDEGKEMMQGLLRGVRSGVGSTTINLPLQFAHGGFVPGTGAVPAIVHGGELILNAAQQATLGANVTRWANTAMSALRMAGQSVAWVGDLLTQMKHESGGNPRAVNRWDINWILGHPSMGLMQTIQSTFNAFAGSLRDRGIFDPLANIFAAIMYTLRRYGDLGAWRRRGFRGYAEGGIISGPTLALLGEAGREAVIPLTRPQRALDLMHMAGLDAMVMKAQEAQSSRPNISDVTMLRVDHAEIFDKVDVDIIAARIRKAYTTMAGH